MREKRLFRGRQQAAQVFIVFAGRVTRAAADNHIVSRFRWLARLEVIVGPAPAAFVVVPINNLAAPAACVSIPQTNGDCNVFIASVVPALIFPFHFTAEAHVE